MQYQQIILFCLLTYASAIGFREPTNQKPIINALVLQKSIKECTATVLDQPNSNVVENQKAFTAQALIKLDNCASDVNEYFDQTCLKITNTGGCLDTKVTKLFAIILAYGYAAHMHLFEGINKLRSEDQSFKQLELFFKMSLRERDTGIDLQAELGKLNWSPGLTPKQKKRALLKAELKTVFLALVSSVQTVYEVLIKDAQSQYSSTIRCSASQKGKKRYTISFSDNK
jgi:hypothetical protein